MSTLSNHLINPIYADQVLSILQHYLREVAERQYALGLSANNILAVIIRECRYYKTSVWTDFGLGLGLGP